MALSGWPVASRIVPSVAQATGWLLVAHSWRLPVHLGPGGRRYPVATTDHEEESESDEPSGSQRSVGPQVLTDMRVPPIVGGRREWGARPSAPGSRGRAGNSQQVSIMRAAVSARVAAQGFRPGLRTVAPIRGAQSQSSRG